MTVRREKPSVGLPRTQKLTRRVGTGGAEKSVKGSPGEAMERDHLCFKMSILDLSNLIVSLHKTVINNLIKPSNAVGNDGIEGKLV